MTGKKETGITDEREANEIEIDIGEVVEAGNAHLPEAKAICQKSCHPGRAVTFLAEGLSQYRSFRNALPDIQETAFLTTAMFSDSHYVPYSLSLPCTSR